MMEPNKTKSPAKPSDAPKLSVEKAKEQLSGTDPKMLAELIRRILENGKADC